MIQGPCIYYTLVGAWLDRIGPALIVGMLRLGNSSARGIDEPKIRRDTEVLALSNFPEIER
jgi:hypothetical protein